MDIVRVILAKAEDESTEPLPDFYCTADEYTSAAGVKTVAERISRLFEK